MSAPSSERAFADFITEAERTFASWERFNRWVEPIAVTLRNRYDAETELHRVVIGARS